MKLTKREQVAKFMKCYETNLALTNGCEQAYELAETDWLNDHGCNKYKNYQSFRACRTNWRRYGRSFHKVLR